MHGYAILRADGALQAREALRNDAYVAGFYVYRMYVNLLPDGLTDEELEDIAESYLRTSYCVLRLPDYGEALHAYIIGFELIEARR